MCVLRTTRYTCFVFTVTSHAAAAAALPGRAMQPVALAGHVWSCQPFSQVLVLLALPGSCDKSISQLAHAVSSPVTPAKSAHVQPYDMVLGIA
jgi:hypothetical protein